MFLRFEKSNITYSAMAVRPSSPFLPGAGVLRIPSDGFGACHHDVKKNVVRHALVGPYMAGARVPVVDESLFHLHRPIREEGEEIARSVSGIFLLPTFGVADTPVLNHSL